MGMLSGPRVKWQDRSQKSGQPEKGPAPVPHRSRGATRQEGRCRFLALPTDYLVSTSQSRVELEETNLRNRYFMNEFLLLAVIMIYVAILY
jgi:hypothetical protein